MRTANHNPETQEARVDLMLSLLPHVLDQLYREEEARAEADPSYEPLEVPATLTVPQLAEILGCSESTVKRAIRSAREKLCRRAQALHLSLDETLTEHRTFPL